jgi:phosphate/sulfate permease
MDALFVITILIVIGALAFDFINGFHDTANSIATSVSTKALKPRHAIILAAVMNFVGAMTFTGVAKTITKRYCRSFYTTKWRTCYFSGANCSDFLEPTNLVLWNS